MVQAIVFLPLLAAIVAAWAIARSATSRPS
jgi:hypothetical protein